MRSLEQIDLRLLRIFDAMDANRHVTRAAEEWFRQPVIAALRAQGLSSEWYYTTTGDLADKKVSMGGTQPDTGRNVNGLTNAVSVLIETRGVGLGRVHLARRVQTHVVALESLLRSAAARAAWAYRCVGAVALELDCWVVGGILFPFVPIPCRSEKSTPMMTPSARRVTGIRVTLLLASKPGDVCTATFVIPHTQVAGHGDTRALGVHFYSFVPAA